MPARALDRRWTEEEFYAARDAAPPGERWELVDGEVLVTPSPHWVHQRIVARLFALIHQCVSTEGLGEAFPSPLDVKLEPGLVLVWHPEGAAEPFVVDLVDFFKEVAADDD